MFDENKILFQSATDVVMTFMPLKGKTPAMIEAAIHEVHADMIRGDRQPPFPDAEDEDAYDPETGLLKEASTFSFFEKWAREAEAEAAKEKAQAAKEKAQAAKEKKDHLESE